MMMMIMMYVKHCECNWQSFTVVLEAVIIAVVLLILIIVVLLSHCSGSSTSTLVVKSVNCLIDAC